MLASILIHSDVVARKNVIIQGGLLAQGLGNKVTGFERKDTLSDIFVLLHVMHAVWKTWLMIYGRINERHQNCPLGGVYLEKDLTEASCFAENGSIFDGRVFSRKLGAFIQAVLSAELQSRSSNHYDTVRCQDWQQAIDSHFRRGVYQRYSGQNN